MYRTTFWVFLSLIGSMSSIRLVFGTLLGNEHSHPASKLEVKESGDMHSSTAGLNVLLDLRNVQNVPSTVIDQRIAEQMTADTACQLPCWWTIEPGDNSSSALQVFNKINPDGWVPSLHQRGTLNEIGSFIHVYRDEKGENLYSYFRVDVWTQENKLQLITISMYPDEKSEAQEKLIRDWSRYEMVDVFASLGQPEHIHLLPQNIADGDGFTYSFNLYYPSRGVALSYRTGLQPNTADEELCLSLSEMDATNFYLYEPGTQLPPGYLQQTYALWPLADKAFGDEQPLLAGSALVNRTGISIDMFFNQVMSAPHEIPCVTIPD